MKLKHYLFGILGLFLLIALGKTQGILFDDGLAYVAINHGNHKHYFPKVKDEGLGIDAFPTRPPGQNEFISPQGQIIKTIKDERNTYYVPENKADVPLSNFPTRAPVSGEQITPNGEIISTQK